jgi:hypothetical protein
MKNARAIAATAAMLTLAATAVSAQAQTIPVGVTQQGGSRTITVEDLTGAPLSSLELDTSRSLPFRVHVVDTTYDRKAFTTEATMSNLYKSTGGSSYDYATKIASNKISLDRLTAPVDALNISSVLKPAFTVVATITDPLLCATASLPVVGGVCSKNLSSQLDGVQQTVNSTVDLSQLSKLPLVPQAPAPGPFTNPSFQGIGAGDTAGIAAAGSTTPTPHQVVGGVLGTSAYLTAVQSSLSTLVSGLPAANVIAGGENTLLAALTNTISIPSILPSQVSFAASLVNLTAANVISQTGTYYSYPVLNVDTTGAPQGAYRGTLVLTTIET